MLRRAAHDIAFHVVNGFAVSVRMLERHDFLSIRTNLSYSIALYEPSGIAFRTECGHLGKHPVCRCVVDYDGTVVPLGLSKTRPVRAGQHNITIPRMTKGASMGEVITEKDKRNTRRRSVPPRRATIRPWPTV